MPYPSQAAFLIATLFPLMVMAQNQTPLTEPMPAASGMAQPPATTYAIEPVDAPAESSASAVEMSDPSFKMVHLPDEAPFRRIDQWRHRTPIGTATEKLLGEQASGVRAAPLLPTLGATADLSWKRYLGSFTHPIPDAFETRVETK